MNAAKNWFQVLFWLIIMLALLIPYKLFTLGKKITNAAFNYSLKKILTPYNALVATMSPEFQLKHLAKNMWINLAVERLTKSRN